jgi:hypothetical protein
VLVLSCSVALVDGQCPDGSAAWVEIAADIGEAAVLMPSDIEPLLSQIVVLWVIAVAVRFVVRAIRS